MTRRERLERRLERRETWSASARAKSDRSLDAASSALDGIEPGQPILVGHHSERHHRAALDRHDSRMRKGLELAEKADLHASKAANLEHQLDRTVFSDDDDAVEKLEARIAEREEERARRKELNKVFAKGGVDGLRATLAADQARLADILRGFALCPYERRPYPPYSLSNLGASIRQDRERVAEVKGRIERAARSEAAGGVLVEGTGEHCRVTFAEKPDRGVLDALRVAGFCWSSGSWWGRRAALPPTVETHLLPAVAPKCGEPTIGPDDLVRPCVLQSGHDSHHDGGRA